jgi:hypothetical protein
MKRECQRRHAQRELQLPREPTTRSTPEAPGPVRGNENVSASLAHLAGP